MEILNPKGTWKRYWRRKRYQRLDGALATRRNVKVTRFGTGGNHQRRFWRIKAVPKFRFLKMASPMKLLTKLKNAYIKMMLNLAGNVSYFNTPNTFGQGRVPKSRQLAPVVYSNDEVENRLIYEIYKALVATRDLAPYVEQKED